MEYVRLCPVVLELGSMQKIQHKACMVELGHLHRHTHKHRHTRTPLVSASDALEHAVGRLGAHPVHQVLPFMMRFLCVYKALLGETPLQQQPIFQRTDPYRLPDP